MDSDVIFFLCHTLFDIIINGGEVWVCVCDDMNDTRFSLEFFFMKETDYAIKQTFYFNKNFN